MGRFEETRAFFRPATSRVRKLYDGFWNIGSGGLALIVMVLGLAAFITGIIGLAGGFGPIPTTDPNEVCDTHSGVRDIFEDDGDYTIICRDGNTITVENI